MRFSTLLKALENGQAGLKHSQQGSDPELRGAASLDSATADQLSFLEKGNTLISSLADSAVGAVLLPDQADLITLASQRGLAYAVLADPRLPVAAVARTEIPRVLKRRGGRRRRMGTHG